MQHAETGQITAQIEAYMTDPANKTRTVKPCDIIFLIEQSQFMNTHDSANPGGERAEILSAMESLLNELPTPPPRRRAPHCDRGLRPHQQPRHRRHL